MELITQGKTKRLYATDEPGALLMRFGDEATSYDGFTRGLIPGKGAANAQITALLLRLLEKEGIATHLLSRPEPDALLVRRAVPIPLEVIIRNVAAGSLSRRLGLPEGTKLTDTIIEYDLHSDELDDPLVNEYHIAAMNWATPEQLEQISSLAMRCDQILTKVFAAADIELVDFKLEFGTDGDGRVLVIDEIDPDTCRLWDLLNRQRLDKDIFQREHDGSERAYHEVLRRLRAAFPTDEA